MPKSKKTPDDVQAGPGKTAKEKKLADTHGFTDENASIQSLNKDLVIAAATMTESEARFLVDHYYISQENRIRFDGQVRAMGESQEPNMVLGWLGEQSGMLEAQIQRALDKYTTAHPIGSWIKSIFGLGPVLAAGFLAHIDITKAPAAGNIWSYAGLLDPEEQKWEKGAKRPWNAQLKVLCWKAGESFVKFSNNDKCYYGKLFKERREFELNRNWTGQNVEKAIRARAKYKAEDSEAMAWLTGCYKAEEAKQVWLEKGSLAAAAVAKIKGEPGSGLPMLPPMQIHARSRRFAVKIFLSHLHEFWYETHFKRRVPKPYVFEHLGHVHRIAVPGYDSPYAGNEPPAAPYHHGYKRA